MFDQQLGRKPLLRGVYAGLRRCSDVAVLELSRGGARLIGREIPEDGDELMLELEGVRAFGTVAWVRGGEFGVAFNEPLRVGQLNKLEHQHLELSSGPTAPSGAATVSPDLSQRLLPRSRR